MTRYFAFGKETEYGTLASNREMYLDLGKCGIDVPSEPYLDVPTMERTPSRAKKGLYSPEGSSEYAMDIISLQHFMYYALGGYKFTAAPSGQTINTHEIYVTQNRTLPSFTSFIGRDTFEHQMLGCVIDKLGINISDGLAMCNFDVKAQKDKKEALTNESSITRHDGYPLAFYEARAYRGTNEISADVNSFETEISNGLDPAKGQGLNSMFPYRMKPANAELTIKISQDYNDTDEIEQFWGSATGPTTKTIVNDYSINFTDEDANILNMKFPKCYIKSVGQPIEGSDNITQEIGIGVLSKQITLADTSTKVKTPLICEFLTKTSNLTA